MYVITIIDFNLCCSSHFASIYGLSNTIASGNTILNILSCFSASENAFPYFRDIFNILPYCMSTDKDALSNALKNPSNSDSNLKSKVLCFIGLYRPSYMDFLIFTRKLYPIPQ